MVGKKTIIATIAILEAGFVSPNQLLVIGAKAIIGTELAAIAKGIIASLMTVQRAVTNATKTPAPQPIANPPTAAYNVAKVASTRIDVRPLPNSPNNSSKIADGRGSKNCWMLNTRTANSQITRTPMATNTVGR